MGVGIVDTEGDFEVALKDEIRGWYFEIFLSLSPLLSSLSNLLTGVASRRFRRFIYDMLNGPFFYTVLPFLQVFITAQAREEAIDKHGFRLEDRDGDECFVKGDSCFEVPLENSLPGSDLNYQVCALFSFSTSRLGLASHRPVLRPLFRCSPRCAS